MQTVSAYTKNIIIIRVSQLFPCYKKMFYAAAYDNKAAQRELSDVVRMLTMGSDIDPNVQFLLTRD